MNTATIQQNQMASTAPRLDTAGIAAILGVTREHVTDRITKRPDFPKPFINVSRRLRYWRASEVQAWMTKKR
ncbi:hypothetical protein [Comamonas testosteroni]|uniref:helix-turn-helix transcriptional regulator n=1 Tax=Comamonas testosteroni TaxID=285 RepID=UPI0028E6FD9E|nr:hypothetical protein [Comamonas testosteroni]